MLPTLDRCTASPVAALPSTRRSLAALLDHVVHLELKPAAAQATAAYTRQLLHRDDRHEVMAAGWVAGRSCPLHSHGDSAVLLRVRSGVLIEERYLPDGHGGYRYEAATLRGGDESHLPAGTFHRVRCVEAADTVHVFHPPPTDPVKPVPEDLASVLAAAKRRVVQVITTGDATGDLSAVVDRHLDAWADREAERTRAGHTRAAAETIAEFRTSGLLAAPVPVELGGWGASLADVAEAIRRVARRAPATALSLAMPLGNAATARIPDGAVPEPCRTALAAGRRWVARQAVDGRLLAVANSEPGAGGDLAQTRTVARLAPDGTCRLTGRKAFATLGPDADYFLCAARTEAGTVDGFFVPRGAAGVALGDDWDPLGMRTTASVGLTLTDAPAAAVLGYPGCLEGVNARHWSTVLFAAVFVGIGEGAVDAAVDGIGAAGAESHYARATVAEVALDLEAAAGLLEAAASDERWPLPAAAKERTVRAKTFAAKTAVNAAARTAMLCGGRSYRADHVVTRLLHDALAGPLLRPPLAKAMDDVARAVFG